MEYGEDNDLELSSSSFFIPGRGGDIIDEQTMHRRKVRKTRSSAVVLNIEALRRCIESSPSNNVVTLDKQIEIENQIEMVMKVQRAWRSAFGRRSNAKKHESRHANIIQRWFRRKALRELSHEKLQRGLLSLSIRQVELLLALVLGHRVRVLMRCDNCKQAISSIKDTLLVLDDVFHPLPKSSSPSQKARGARCFSVTLEKVGRILRSKIEERLVFQDMGMTSSDRLFASSLLRQLETNKRLFWDCFFRASRWVSGKQSYLDLWGSMKINNVFGNRANLAKTPPRRFSLKSDGSHSTSTTTQRVDDSFRGLQTPPRNLNLNAILGSFDREQEATCLVPCPPTRGSQRAGPRSHIQLEILAADHLVSSVRRRRTKCGDSVSANPPDRKPCLRIALMLPPSSMTGAAAKSPLLTVKKLSRDFNVETLSPRWNSTFYVPLPCPRSLLPTEEVLRSVTDSGLPEESNIYAPLLNWWAGGILRIEIVDGERFNSDIYLGHVDIFLSQFLLSRSSSIGGTFPLSKQNPTDRVTGTITLNAFLHLPEISSVLELTSQVIDNLSSRPNNDALEPDQEQEQEQEQDQVQEPYSKRETPEKSPFRIAKSVRMSRQSRSKTPSPAVMRTVSPVQTDSSASRIAEPVSPPPPPPLRPSPAVANSRHPTAGDLVRRQQISDCLADIDEQVASTSELLGLINNMKMSSKRSPL